MNKRRIIVISLILILISIITLGTISYFKTDSFIKNKFLIASYTSDGKRTSNDSKFSIKVYETADNKMNLSGKTFTGVLPGSFIFESPIILNDGSYQEYVRVTLTLTNASNWLEAFKDTDIKSFNEILVGLDDKKLSFSDDAYYDITNDTLTYTYYLLNLLEPNESEKLYTALHIPESFGINQLKAIEYFEITIKADAVQKIEGIEGCVETFKFIENQKP